ncbi:MAG: copper homeostasis protein CutC [Anaerolineae bacterium]|nr:copper homeostasis protein CutC [Anaerolineae bacterium]
MAISSSDIRIEVCVDSVESALGAQAGGADRVELCDNLMEGGTTPSAGTIAVARRVLQLGLQVMIRPRGGDFCYSDLEFESMQHDIEVAKSHGADGVVFGLLLPDGRVDVERTRRLVEQARPLSVTFHRAFDVARDPFEALEALIQMGVDRILTTGQEPTVLEGLDLITELVRVAGDRVIILAGAGSKRVMQKVVAQSGVREIHIVAPRAVDSPMTYRHDRVFMGGELRPPEFTRTVTDPSRVRQFRQAVSGIIRTDD